MRQFRALDVKEPLVPCKLRVTQQKMHAYISKKPPEGGFDKALASRLLG